MTRDAPLRGGCSCGRNKYTVLIPQEANEVARVIFSNSENHPTSNHPLSAFLRIPLTWYTSTTHSYRPDETSTTIRRTYTSPSEQASIRHFCGFCGTSLAYWTEEPREEREFICLTVGSLKDGDLKELVDAGVLPRREEDLEGEGDDEAEVREVVGGDGDGDGGQGSSWLQGFTGSSGITIGNKRRSLGQKTSRDGKVTVEWEIMEWSEGDGYNDGEVLRPVGNGKRKLEEVEDEDKRMSDTS